MMEDITPNDCSPLSAACIKGLTDRLEGKRKYAATQIEKMTLEFSISKNLAMIDKLVNVLGKRFCLSQLPNARKGGLIGLAAVMVGFQNGTEESPPRSLVDDVVRPILTCFQDPDSRVRYYACEALYNVIKVAKSNISHLFLDIFDNLAKVIADLDISVRNGAEIIDKLLRDIVCEENIIELKLFITKLRDYLYTRNTFTRMFVISWIRLLESIESDMILHLPEILDGLFHCLYDSTEELRASLLPTMSQFLDKIASQQSKVESSTMLKLIQVLSRELQVSDHPTVKLAILDWFIKLRLAHPDIIFKDFNLQHTLLETLTDDSDDVVKKTLQVLADVLCFDNPDVQEGEDESRKSPIRTSSKIAKKVVISASDSTDIDKFMHALYKLFKEREVVFNERASFIIIHLCNYLRSEIVYKSFAAQLVDETQDLKFAYHLVQKLNEILFTAKALYGLRSKLSLACEDGSPEMTSLFQILYHAWCHSPIATLSICFLTNNFKLTNEIVLFLPQLDVTLDSLVEIDKLVQLIESPIFISMRLKLLDSDNYHLLKSLYGLLMVLPQSEAFKKLRTRLKCVQNFTASAQPKTAAKTPSQTIQPQKKTFPTQEMMKHFQSIQMQHLRLREM